MNFAMLGWPLWGFLLCTLTFVAGTPDGRTWAKDYNVLT